MAPLAVSMTPGIEQIIGQGSEIRGEETEEKGMHQGQNEEKALTDLPGECPYAFETEFGFIEAERHLDLPPSCVDENDFEGLL